uniref:Trichome birefringence-like N-terminal domain-containing protein n=1 Tax=Chenopodium quinoa TaxID=63459 RepID=A0A803MYE9_CHEQI
MYDSLQCPSIRKEFDCLKYGRPDKFYLKFRWQPEQCDLPRFDGVDFLKRMSGKKIMIIMSVMLYPSSYLVDIENEQKGRVLKLNSIKGGEMWKDMDVLIFNTWLWWSRKGPKQPWDYIQDGTVTSKDMDRMDAYRKALMTWAKWVDSEIDPMKTRVFFQGTNPSHYNGQEWNATGVMDCSKETMPMKGSTYPGALPPALEVAKQVISTISKPVYLLDITTLSQLRKDGHPSSYNGFKGMDCTHWCVAGLPDTWNQLLYTTLIM